MSHTTATQTAYRRRALALITQAKNELSTARLSINQLTDWFLSHHSTWAASTIRQYRAALTQAISDAVSQGKLQRERGEFLLERLRGLLVAGRQTAPRARKTPVGRKKLKNLSPKLAVKLVSQLNEGRAAIAKLAARLLETGPIIGLRPCEWRTLEVYDGCCRVQNAKNTNDRACGTMRVPVTPAHEQFSESLAELKEAIDAITEQISWQNLQRRLNYILRRACRNLGMKKPVTLSTLRHVAIGRWKCVFQPDEVAALAGHSSNATAVAHYGRRRSGAKWPPITVRPYASNIARVRDRFYRYEPKRQPSTTAD